MVDATSPAALKNALAERSRAEGFEVMRVTHADAIPQAAGTVAAFSGRKPAWRYGLDGTP